MVPIRSRCLILQPVHAAGLDLLRREGVDPILCPDLREDTIDRLIPGCSAVITRDAGFPTPFFRKADRLEVISVHGTGHDAVDKVEAARRNITVCNAPGVNARSVAELALGLSIALARLIPAADRNERSGGAGFRDRYRFTELHGKTALIVGWGAVGSAFGRMLHDGLGMKVVVYSPNASDLGGFPRADTLQDGFAVSDLVSLHTPLSSRTRGLIDAPAFAAMKPGTLLVNTARAGLLDEDALADAISQGKIAGAALDVYTSEAPQGPLGQSDRVIFTPHLGGTTEDAAARVAVAAASHVLEVLAGRFPATVIRA